MTSSPPTDGKDKFQKTFEKAKSYDVQEMDDINSLDDYFDWLDVNLTWIPVENKFGRVIAKAYPVARGIELL